jgi:hypothetical protein
MRNLHEIHPDLPDWAKKMILAWYEQQPKHMLSVTYITTSNELGFYTVPPSSEERWRIRGWTEYMKRVDITKYPPEGLKITIR